MAGISGSSPNGTGCFTGTSVASKARAILLLSGGLDSAVAGALAASRGRQLSALSFDYGQRHPPELRRARAQAKALKIGRPGLLRPPPGGNAKGALGDASRGDRSG